MNHDKAKKETIKSFEESLKKYKLDLEKNPNSSFFIGLVEQTEEYIQELKQELKQDINKNMTAREILQNLSTLDLIIISEELNEEFIPLDAKVRKVASDIYYIGSNETTLVMLIGLGTLIAYELSQRIKNNNI